MSDFDYKELQEEVAKWQPLLDRITEVGQLAASWSVSEDFGAPTVMLKLTHEDQTYYLYPEQEIATILEPVSYDAEMETVTVESTWAELRPQLLGVLSDSKLQTITINAAQDDWASDFVANLNEDRLQSLLVAIHDEVDEDTIRENVDIWDSNDEIDRNALDNAISDIDSTLRQIRNLSESVEGELSGFRQ